MLKDCYKIYSNEQILSTLTSMISSGRLSQSFLIFGTSGVGKKTLARYFSAKLLCENNSNSPCGECRSCKLIAQNSHPDVKIISTSEDSKAFSVEKLRHIVSDAHILPNDADKKIYILADCDKMSQLAQNALLKIIEEPPAHAYFIFTASSKAVFLPTILSRVISLGMNEVSNSECRLALLENGVVDEEMIKNAIEAFNGNIGKCLEFINDKNLANAVEISKSITDAMISTSEYSLLKAFSQLEGNKILTKAVITMLCAIVRDCCSIRLGNDILVGCYKKGSNQLASTITLSKADEIYRVLCEADSKIDGNANLSLTLAYICSQIKK